jgi:hypothetical protein
MRYGFIGLIAAFLVIGPSAAAPVAAQSDTICFPEAAPVITDCISGRFAQFWRANGGLAVFGYPISAAVTEVNQEDVQPYLTQYFERQRFEYHPEHTAPYDIQLGRMGDDYLRHTGHDWHAMPHADPSTPHYVPETGHAIAPEFYDYYRHAGVELADPGVSVRESLALFGYPLSNIMTEWVDEQEVRVQYFERARLEYHPNNPEQYRVLQGRLGSDLAPGHVEHHPTTAPPHHDDDNPPDPGDTHPDDDHRNGDHPDDPHR